MWTCSKCGEKLQDNFDSCWKCNHTRAGEPVVASTQHLLDCVRCAIKMEYVGTKRFHEGPRWGVLGDLGELFVKRESFDVFVCPRCGRVEFFIEGIGEEFRPALSERGARALLSAATKLETKGEVQEALALYHEAVIKYPDTKAGQDAARRVEALTKKSEENDAAS